MKVGYSVSLCIKDVLEGRVEIAEVEKIVGSTCARSPADWDIVIESYRELYWYDAPDRGEEICRKLIAEGRIDQPRTRRSWYHRNPALPLWRDEPCQRSKTDA